jgi:hypothetical protein
VSNIFLAHEYVHVLPDLSLLGYAAGAHAWTPFPERFEGVSQDDRSFLNNDVGASGINCW